MQCLSNRFPEARVTTADRTFLPSLFTDSIRPNGHLSRTFNSSQTNTSYPTYRFSFSFCHLVRFCSVCKYSLVHLSQNKSTKDCVFFQLYLNWSAPGGFGGKRCTLLCETTLGYKKLDGQSGVISLISELA